MRRTTWVAVIWLGLSAAGHCAIPEAGPLDYSGHARVAFEGDSTLHGFHGHAATDEIRVHVDAVTNAAAGATWDAAGELRVLALSTDHEKRDANMLAMLHADLFPTVDAVLEDAPVPVGDEVEAPLRLRIGSHDATVPATISAWTQTVDGVTFRLQFEVSLHEFGLKPPSVLGLIKVGDVVKVDCEVVAGARHDADVARARPVLRSEAPLRRVASARATFGAVENLL